VRGHLGWAIIGVAARSRSEEIAKKVNVTKMREAELHEQVENFWKTESFGKVHETSIAISVEDRHSMHILQESTKLVNGQYEAGCYGNIQIQHYQTTSQ
jgi:hypothetical protein